MHRFAKPLTTRYLRLTAEEIYKQAGGLAAIEVWSDKPLPRFLIKNGHVGGGAKKGRWEGAKRASRPALGRPPPSAVRV